MKTFNRLTSDLVTARASLYATLNTGSTALSTLAADPIRADNTLAWRAEGWAKTARTLFLIEGIASFHERMVLDLLPDAPEGASYAQRIPEMDESRWDALADRICSAMAAQALSELMRDETSGSLTSEMEAKANRAAWREVLELVGFASWRLARTETMAGVIEAVRAEEAKAQKERDAEPATLHIQKREGVYCWMITSRANAWLTSGMTKETRRKEGETTAKAKAEQWLDEWMAKRPNVRRPSLKVEVEVTA